MSFVDSYLQCIRDYAKNLLAHYTLDMIESEDFIQEFTCRYLDYLNKQFGDLLLDISNDLIDELSRDGNIFVSGEQIISHPVLSRKTLRTMAIDYSIEEIALRRLLLQECIAKQESSTQAVLIDYSSYDRMVISYLDKALNTKRATSIVINRLCLLDDCPQTLDQIGDRLGITRERVRQILVKSLRFLKTHHCRNDLWLLSSLIDVFSDGVINIHNIRELIYFLYDYFAWPTIPSLSSFIRFMRIIPFLSSRIPSAYSIQGEKSRASLEPVYESTTILDDTDNPNDTATHVNIYNDVTRDSHYEEDDKYLFCDDETETENVSA